MHRAVLTSLVTLALAGASVALASTSFAAGPDPAGAAPAGEVEAQPATAPGAPGVVRVHIDTEDPQVQLHRWMGASVTAVAPNMVAITSFSSILCRAPCDRVVDGRDGQEFYFAGKDVLPSERFQLFDKSGDVSVRVEPGSRGKRIGGVVLLSLGAVGMVTGGMLTLFGYTMKSYDYGSDGTDRETDSAPALKTIGPVVIGAGVGMLVGGIVLLATSGTKYQFSDSGRTAQASSKKKLPAVLQGRF